MLEMLLGGAGLAGNLLSNIFGKVNSKESYNRMVDPFTNQMVQQSRVGLNTARANRRGEVAGVMRRSNAVGNQAASRAFGNSLQQGLGAGNAGAVQAYTQAMVQDQSEAQGINAANENVYQAEMQHSNTLGRAADQTMYRFQQQDDPNFALRAGRSMQDGAAVFGDSYAGGKTLKDLFANSSNASNIPNAMQRVNSRNRSTSRF